MDDAINEALVHEIREAAHRVTGGNMTFADDDLRVLEMLAVTAVRAGLTEGLHPSVAETAVAACAKHPSVAQAGEQPS